MLGIAPSATAAEHQKLGLLPQHFADQHGWSEMAAQVAAIYNALPPADRAKAVFLGLDYGEAAAIDVFGRPLGLPPAISGHNNYYLWGPQGHDGSVLIVLGPYWGRAASGVRAESRSPARSTTRTPCPTRPARFMYCAIRKCRSLLYGLT